jgi:hypothetical protein
MNVLCKVLLWSCLIAYWRTQPRKPHEEGAI